MPLQNIAVYCVFRIDIALRFPHYPPVPPWNALASPVPFIPAQAPGEV